MLASSPKVLQRLKDELQDLAGQERDKEIHSVVEFALGPARPSDDTHVLRARVETHHRKSEKLKFATGLPSARRRA